MITRPQTAYVDARTIDCLAEAVLHILVELRARDQAQRLDALLRRWQTGHMSTDDFLVDLTDVLTSGVRVDQFGSLL